jgi:pimeloyl-ACP methyl ester carboxylesterase
MRLLRSRSLGLALTLAVSMLTTLTLGLALAQDKPADPDDPKAAPAKEKPAVKDLKDAKDPKNAKAKRKGPVAGGAPPKKNRPNGADPLGKNAAAAAVAAKAADPNAKAAAAKAVAFMADPVWPFHFRLKISGGDGAPIAASYYPPKGRYNAPAVLLIHDRGPGRSGKDWQEPLDELKGLSLAESLQEQGYAVLVPDLRGHGANPRKELTPNEWRALPADIQAMYLFLVDRHNRGELNVAKLGVMAIGDGANLTAAWASLPGAAVSSEGRTSDLSALVLISPVELANGLPLLPMLKPIASKLPIYMLCGDRDAASIKVVKDAQPTVERNQRSKVTYYDTPLHGYRLLHLFPKVASAVTKFLEDPVKGRVLEWEPRYLLTPVTYANEGVFESKNAARVTEATKKAEAAKNAEPAKKKDAN